MTYQDLPPPPQDEGFYEAQPVYAFDAFGLRRYLVARILPAILLRRRR